MKIGVALSGCDMGGVGAHYLLDRLAAEGVAVDALSLCSVPALTGLLWAAGYDAGAAGKKAKQLLYDAATDDIDAAIARFCDTLHMGRDRDALRLPTAVSAVNVADGKSVVFTNSFLADAQNLTAFPLDDAYDACSATVSLMDGLASYHYRDCRLCDYTVWHGAPYQALRLMGAEKILSFSFEPRHPRTPYEVLVRQMLRRSASAADLHIPIEFAGHPQALEEYHAACDMALDGAIRKILWKTLF